MTKFASNVLLSGCLFSLSLAAASGAPNVAEDPCGLGAALNAQPEFLTACRPEPASAAYRTAILDSLPSQGAVSGFTAKDQQKLDALHRVLQVHGREGIYAIKVIDIPQAWTGLHGRSVVLISKTALRLLGSEELQALIAHEIGHEYLWADYESSNKSGDSDRLRDLETACDGIAVRTLQALDIEPNHLIKAFEKVANYNATQFGQPDNADSYPSPRERRRFVKELVATR